jgi:hypothetical protein
VKPEATVVVREHNSGVDLVEVTILDGRYPPELLTKQIKTLGELMKADPRGTRILRDDFGSGDPKMAVLKATFAIDGLVEGKGGTLHLSPIVKAMAGAPAPNTIDGLSVFFENQTLNPQSVRAYSSEAVQVEAMGHPGGVGVEYRVRLATQDPAKIDIPDTLEDQKAEAVKPKAKPKGFDWTLWSLLAVAALSVGALVYSLLLRSRPRARA